MTIAILEKGEKVSVITGMASLLASLVAGMACIGPLLGIMLGVSGLGWLSSYSYLTLPASMASLTLLAASALVQYAMPRQAHT